MADIDYLRGEFLSQLAEVRDPQTLENLRIAYLGRKGKLAHLFSEMGTLSREERPKFGELLNQLKSLIEGALSEKEKSLGGGVTSDSSFDPTLPCG